MWERVVPETGSESSDEEMPPLVMPVIGESSDDDESSEDEMPPLVGPVDEYRAKGATEKGTKGGSRGWDIQAMAASWHLYCLELQCRIWIEWVPSGDNPADILSREKKSLTPPSSGEVDDMKLPPWVDLRGHRDITRILDNVDAGCGRSLGMRRSSHSPG